MLDGHLLVLFLAAATLLAVTPGPGIFYVLTRTLAGGKREVGVLSVLLNTTADVLVVSFAAPIGARLRSSVRFRRNQRVASGVAMMGLGAFVAFGDSK
jgi:threonine/homoserine/homoserine lactone efflux protein